MKRDTHILRNMRFKKEIVEKLTEEAQLENRSFNNLVEYILIKYVKQKQ
jgi:predicted HicB family RNase H-like nuclease